MYYLSPIYLSLAIWGPERGETLFSWFKNGQAWKTAALSIEYSAVLVLLYVVKDPRLSDARDRYRDEEANSARETSKRSRWAMTMVPEKQMVA